jgi:hypothetical protein
VLIEKLRRNQTLIINFEFKSPHEVGSLFDDAPNVPVFSDA